MKKMIIIWLNIIAISITAFGFLPNDPDKSYVSYLEDKLDRL